MKGLLLKDVYTLTKQLKLYFVLILVFSVIPGLSSSGFAVIYASMFPITALAYDERSKWDNLAVMMPYSPTCIVMSKYVLGYTAIGCSGVLSVCVQLAINLSKGAYIFNESVAEIIFLVCAAIVLQSVILPIIFKLGVEKGRIAYLAAFAVFACIIAWVGMTSEDSLDITLSTASLILPVVIFSVIVSIASVKISTIIYKNKEF